MFDVMQYINNKKPRDIKKIKKWTLFSAIILIQKTNLNKSGIKYYIITRFILKRHTFIINIYLSILLIKIPFDFITNKNDRN
jgi:hypothetical protein